MVPDIVVVALKGRNKRVIKYEERETG
ncbi:hypothetical protein ig2599ANME_0500, partial [groundwater metagenome]